MGVMVMSKTDTHIDEAMKWIKRVLMKNYHLKAEDAMEAINNSGVREVYGRDVEMSSHTPIENWAKLVYTHWKANGGNK